THRHRMGSRCRLRFRRAKSRKSIHLGGHHVMYVPSELLDYKQWVLWRKAEVNGRVTKIPISPWCGKSAACDRPQTWSTYRHVCYTMRRFRCDGVGFVFTDSD